ncbi:cell division protein FtsB [Lutibacter sp. Hel_I_33_5]|uniref:FtsB family cell division protein n=1 Tax=Lutibacter sp. Hel_I_33_5 TaxID=1566289 RepID=UPI0011A5FFEB|nr:septum formation initiator family protein [Lutibacter sp. Hel_I_33_5]TVZ55751.1 cell division protein FtsB [Lutibacter sp. Hel_I_33_5]
MNLSKFTSNPILKILTNKYVLILAVFIVWMTFFDENSFFTHNKYNKEIEDLQKTVNFYKSEIKEDKETIKKLKDSLQLERYAREKYYMKKENEDIYLIEFDTIKK